MKKMKGLTILLIVTFLLAACGEPKVKNETMMETAETFVQALIDGDEKTIEELNRDEEFTTSSIINSYSPDFSGIKIEDVEFEFKEETNQVEVSDGTMTYWFTIEKIGEKYFVTRI